MNQRKATKLIVHDGHVGARDEKLFGDDLQRFQVDDLEQILIIAGNIVESPPSTHFQWVNDQILRQIVHADIFVLRSVFHENLSYCALQEHQ
ncbi:hypothetical protein Mapa_006187 [Marchantia paleacea]|nr:hypothetical protein Mapa_006187 [Marchantia paleacea]